MNYLHLHISLCCLSPPSPPPPPPPPHTHTQSLLAPITDLHYRHLAEDLDRSFMREDVKLRVEASKMAIVALLKSWPGVYCLCSPSNNGLVSLLEMLPLTKPEVQREILDLLYSVFQLKVPEWTESFSDAVVSIGESIL